jgi:hypothetical protein
VREPIPLSLSTSNIHQRTYRETHVCTGVLLYLRDFLHDVVTPFCLSAYCYLMRSEREQLEDEPTHQLGRSQKARLCVFAAVLFKRSHSFGGFFSSLSMHPPQTLHTVQTEGEREGWSHRLFVFLTSVFPGPPPLPVPFFRQSSRNRQEGLHGDRLVRMTHTCTTSVLSPCRYLLSISPSQLTPPFPILNCVPPSITTQERTGCGSDTFPYLRSLISLVVLLR